MAILSLALCLTLSISKIPLKNSILLLIRDKLQTFLVWNYLLTFSLSNLNQVSTFATIEYKSLNLNDGFAIASFVVSVLCVLECYEVMIVFDLIVLGFVQVL